MVPAVGPEDHYPSTAEAYEWEHEPWIGGDLPLPEGFWTDGRGKPESSWPSLRSPAVIAALLLDFDQTLIDSNGSTDWWAARQELAARFGPLGIPPVDGCARQAVGVLAPERGLARWTTMSRTVEGYELIGAPGPP